MLRSAAALHALLCRKIRTMPDANLIATRVPRGPPDGVPPRGQDKIRPETPELSLV
jgi:hypothetical protein